MRLHKSIFIARPYGEWSPPGIVPQILTRKGMWVIRDSANRAYGYD